MRLHATLVHGLQKRARAHADNGSAMRWLCAILFFSIPLSALGTPQPGASTTIAPLAPGTLRWPAVAYDKDDDVFLVVSGAGNILGQYLAGDGSALGAPFQVNDVDLYGMAPRVSYSAPAHAFLVAWHESLNNTATQIRGRILSYSAGPVTGDFDISTIGTNWEMGAAMASSATSGEWLVAWADPTNDIQAQRISTSGAQLGAPIAVSDATRYHRDPAVGYDPVDDLFLVAYAGCEAANDCFTEAQRLQVGTGALIGTPSSLDASENATYIPEIAFNTASASWRIAWYRNDGTSASMQSRGMATDGTPDSSTAPASTTNAAYDANGFDYNPLSNTFLLATHGQTALDYIVELDANGAPIGDGDIGDGSSNGNFNPRVAASTRSASWVAVTSTDFNHLTAQIVTTQPATQPPVDAGSPIVDAGSPEIADAGSPSIDAGENEVDAGSPARDAGSQVENADAGPREKMESIKAGCANVDATASAFAFAATFFAFSRRRRR